MWILSFTNTVMFHTSHTIHRRVLKNCFAPPTNFCEKCKIVGFHIGCFYDGEGDENRIDCVTEPSTSVNFNVENLKENIEIRILFLDFIKQQKLETTLVAFYLILFLFLI